MEHAAQELLRLRPLGGREDARRVAALDPELVGEVLELVRGLKENGMTMVIATHEMAFARDVADEVCFLHEGRVLERGDPARIFTAPQRAETQQFLRRVLH